jgi:hypothetical protein
VDKVHPRDHIFPILLTMKIFSACCILLGTSLPTLAAQSPASHPANSKPHASSPANTTAAATPAASTPVAPAPAAPPPAPAPSPSLTLDGYIADLASNLPLSKTEQTDVKTYYLNDGVKLQGILSDATLAPLDQEQKIDDLRNARNAKIEALLADVGRQSEFLKIESNYRVALVELAAQGGLVPSAPTPNVPQPTSTPPNQADKTAPGM